jgi:hypothetical protein
LSLWDMGCSLSLAPLARFVAGGAGARPDHPISSHVSTGLFWQSCQAQGFLELDEVLWAEGGEVLDP